MSKAYTINPDKKTITINDAVKPTVADNKGRQFKRCSH